MRLRSTEQKVKSLRRRDRALSSGGAALMKAEPKLSRSVLALIKRQIELTIAGCGSGNLSSLNSVFLVRVPRVAGKRARCFENCLPHHKFSARSIPNASIIMDGIRLRDEAVRDRIRAATEFLDPTDPRARSYRADIVLMLNRGLRRLVVSIDEIRAHNRELADGILYQPFDFSLCFDEALKRVIATLSNRPPKETAEDTVRSVATNQEILY
jgi:hypothetical protein